MKSINGNQKKDHSPVRPVSIEELRRRYQDELRAMDDVYEDLTDTSDLDTCSATDCTGLIPAPPLSEAELESYNELYHLFPKNSEYKA